ncbi:MAG: lysine--tRNA ligase [Dehalococcoidia bacterium]|nr:lysine--tRNA ligase [Dehalococcoidia bacterium]
MPERGEDHLRSRRQKLERLRQLGVDPYPPRYRRSRSAAEAVALFEDTERSDGAEARTDPVSVAGRIMSLRGMGKATFLDLRDGSGRVQAHLRRDILEEQYGLVRELDLGDFLGVTGPVFRTRRGEVTVEATSLTLLSKSLRPMPEKWHGLRDTEQRYRQRYLDLVSNPEVGAVFQRRSRIISAIRAFLDGRGFTEVDTPVLVPVAAGALARPFATHHHSLDMDLYLRIATELYLKRLIVGGFDKVYELGRVFRNEGMDQDHNPEFTMLESYEAYADYNDVMSMVEEMVSTAATAALGTTRVEVDGVAIEFAPPWERVSLKEEVRRRTGVDIEECPTTSTLGPRLKELGVEVRAHESWGRMVDKLLSSRVEPHLVQPTFLMDYPEEMSPLAKPKPGAPGYVERFEAFAGGMEIANSYTELNDPDLQRQRFLDQEEMRLQYKDEEVDRLDEDFLLSLEYGMPPTGGLGVGIDRLVMLLTGQPTIRDALLFPQMRRVE